MSHVDTKTQIERDADLIRDLGGPARVADKLGFERPGGTRRVHNWLSRGIPSSVKVSRPDLFMAQPKRRPSKAEA